MCVVLALLLVALGAAPARPASPRVMLALGDSLAVPHGSYVDRLYAKLRTPGPWRVDRLVNVAASGETTTSILGRQLAAALRAIRRPSDVRVVTLDIGGNDGLATLACVIDPRAPQCDFPPVGVARACQRGPGLPPCPIRRNVDRLLGALRRALRADPGREAVVVMSLPNPASGTGTTAESAIDHGLLGADGRVGCVAPAEQGLDDLLACAAARDHARLANVYPAFAGRGAQLTNIATGDVHFNAAGHRVAGEVLLRALRPAA
ncbi:MAG: SGNH/GDSL hydrolase family protein [Solirubrobacteraceae bacterium]